MSEELIKKEISILTEDRPLMEDELEEPDLETEPDWSETPTTSPTHDYQTANKKYVDDAGITQITEPTGIATITFSITANKAQLIVAGGASVVLLTPISANTYYKCEIYWDSVNNRVRARINDSTWSNYLTPNVGWTTISAIRIDGNGECYYDDASGSLIEDFEDYDVGILDGQKNWSGSDIFEITESNPHGGTKCIYLNGNATGPWIQKSIVPAASGSQIIYFRIDTLANDAIAIFSTG